MTRFALEVMLCQMRERILVAEDDARLLEILAEELAARGFEVGTALDGEVALHMFREGGSFDLLILDEEMPRLHGRQVLARLRAEGEAVPALLLSGCLEMSEEERRALGVTAVLQKPVSMADLTREIRRAIEDSAAP